MKKSQMLSAVLAVIMLISVIPMSAFASSTSGTEGCLSYEIVDGEVTITDCDESVTGEVVIPETIAGLEVTRIGEKAFESCYYMSGITIPKSIESIGMGAFDNCAYSLVAVCISDMEAWCRMVFEEGWGTTNPLSCVNAYLYLNGEKVTDVVIPEGVSNINEHVFNCYRGMTSISIPKSVASIGWSAFNGCENLKKVYISDLSAWYDIDFINANSNPMCNGADLYLNGEKIKDLVIPANVTSIKESAFEGCTSFESVSIHKNVTSICTSAFEGCTNIRSVYIDDLSAWCGIDFGVWSANPLENGADLYLNGEKITELVIPSQITNVGKYVFAGCQSITSVRFPSSVSSVGVSAFNGCSNLKEVHAEDLLSWCNMKFGQDGSNPLSNDADLYLNGQKVTKIVIPSGVTTIKSGVFQGYKGLTDIIIPEGVTSIEYNAFEGCTGLTSIDIPNSVKGIGQFAFNGCTNLLEVIIPEGVTCVEMYTFEGCTSLASVSIPESVESIEAFAFGDCTSLEEITVPGGVKTINWNVFRGCVNLKSVSIAEGVTRIESSAFEGCTSLEIIYYNGSESEWNAIDKWHVFPDDIQIIYNYIGLTSDEVKVDATKSEIDEDIKLVVESIGDVNGIEEAITNSNSNYVVNDYMLYDISLIKDNQKVQPNGNVTVSICVPDYLNGEDCKVFYIDDSGSPVDMNAVYKNGYMVFVTNHFSYYVVAEVEEQQNPEEPNAPEKPEETKGKWLKDNTGWWYQNADGSYPYKQFQEIDGVIYYFNASGYMVTGWQAIGGTWYYFNGSGAMVTGWQSIGGTWYYFNGSGAMVTGWRSIGGTWYYFNGSGAMVTGWQSIGGTWYYFNGSGAMVTGWQSIGSTWYYFNGSGAMVTGWQSIGGIWYYFHGSGAMAANQWIGNYYLQADGSMATNKWIGNYYVDANGVWVPGKTR